MSSDELLAEQIAYYRARAPEYDHWWERTAQYTLEPELRAQWDSDKRHLTALVDAWLAPFHGGRALELDCGTGIWTSRLAGQFGEVVAVDAAPETIAIARAKLPRAANVRFVEADVFAWEADTEFDVVFFSFWVSHVHDGVWPPNVLDTDGFVEVRTDLSSGDVHRIVKIYYEPAEIEERLASLDWQAQVTSTNR